MTKLFLSYSSKDDTRVVEIRDAIETSGIHCWMAKRDIPPGLNYADCIPVAIQEACAVVVFLSFDSITSSEVAKEINLASKKRLIPVRIDDVSPEDLPDRLKYHLADTQWVDARTDWPSAVKAIVTVVKTQDCSSHDDLLVAHHAHNDPPTVAKAADAAAATWRNTIVPNAQAAGEKAKMMAGRAWTEGSRLAGSAAKSVKDLVAGNGHQNARKAVVPSAASRMQSCADYIAGKYRATGYDAQIVRIEDGGVEGVLVQIRNATTEGGRLFRTVTGLTSCATLKLIPQNADLDVEVMAGKWLDKIGAAAVSLVILWPLLVTASIGAFRQKALLDNLYAESLAWLSNRP